MSEQAAQVPLIELARAVPNDLCGEWQEIDGLRAWHHAPIGRYVHELCDQITELTARAERLQAELAEAHGYGSRLFLRLNPQCEVFDNMPGLMTQFDNYIAGQLQDIAAEKAARERAEQEVVRLKSVLRVCLNGVSCHSLHHDKKDRHGIEDACPVMERLRAAQEG